ncbi:cysteine hydrolase [Granulosicoccus sp.]|nr:cysteine hydrolase [Granulosicoccus sp.]
MNKPKTLFNLVAYVPPIAQFSNTVLVIIDAQNEYINGPIQLPDVADATAKANTLLNAARDAKCKVIHIVHRGSPDGIFSLTSHRGAIIDDLQPRDGEKVIEKTKPNAFAGTDLATELGAPGQSILFAGFMTHMCVSSTVRAALDLGYPATVAGDACATRDLPLVGGGVISAVDLHAAELAGLADRFAAIASVEEVLGAQA